MLFANQSCVPTNRMVTQQVRQADIFPTLLDTLGRPMPGPVDGVSLMPLMRGEAVPETPALMEAVGVKIADERDWLAGIRTEGWKYICAPRNPKIPEELYHLVNDPNEQYNLAHTEKQRAAKLRGQLLAMLGSDEFSQQSELMTEQEMRRIEQRLHDLGYL